MYIEDEVLEALLKIAKYTHTNLDTVISYAFETWSKLEPIERAMILDHYLNNKKDEKTPVTSWLRKILRPFG